MTKKAIMQVFGPGHSQLDDEVIRFTTDLLRNHIVSTTPPTTENISRRLGISRQRFCRLVTALNLWDTLKAVRANSGLHKLKGPSVK